MSSELLSTLRAFPPPETTITTKRDYDQAARSHVTQLSNISASQWLKGADSQQDVLELLDPISNSIAYAHALYHRIHQALEKKTVPAILRPDGALWVKLVFFLEAFDPVQMRYAGNMWRRLVDYTEQVARQVDSPGVAISPIRSALVRLDPTTGTFTMTHLHLLRLCMETRSYAAAEPILDNYIHTIPVKIPAFIRETLEYSVPCADIAVSGDYIHTASNHTLAFTVSDLQEYYVLGAMAYLGLGQYKKALHFLEHVLIVPSHNVANGLMLEAYKKWTIANCLVNGSSKSLPRTTNGNALKQIRAASKAYEALAEAYALLDNLPKLKAQINAGTEIWSEDGNTGLVNELVNSQMKAYISRLSRTFSAIPVSHIAKNVSGDVDEMARYLGTLIKDGQLNAQLERDEKSNMGVVLRFYLDPTQGPRARTEKQQQQALVEQTLRTNTLADQVKHADYRLTLTKEYVENVKRQTKRQAASGDAMDTAWDDAGDAEEDIMVDLH